MTYKTLKELYDSSVEKYRDRTVSSIFERESMTYAQFDGKVRALQAIFCCAGLHPGDKVALVSGSIPNWSVCYFAATVSGYVVVPVLPDFSAQELNSIIIHSEAKALCITDKLYPNIERETIARLNVVIRTKNLAVVVQNCTEPGSTAEPKPEDTAAIIYTSGTTSAPKGVMLSHEALCWQPDLAAELFPVDTDDVFLSVLPLSHTYECSVGMIYPFSRGCHVVYLDRPPTASSLLPALQSVRPTVMLSVPLIIEKIFRAQVYNRFNGNALLAKLYSWGWVRRRIHAMAGKKLYKAFGGRLRFFGIGGAKLDSTTEKFLIDARFPYAIGFGLTETAPLIAGAIPGKTRLGSTGPVISFIDYRLEGVNPETGEGELVVRTPSVMKGYYKNPEATARVFTEDGWFRTNDLASTDSDGYLYIKGRLNNMIVGPSGENIYPEEIETIINGHMLVDDSLVKRENGKLVALVHFNREELERKYKDIKENLGAKMEEIKRDVLNYVNSHVNKFSRISKVEEQKGAFEKTPTHKIKRFLYVKKQQ